MITAPLNQKGRNTVTSDQNQEDLENKCTATDNMIPLTTT